MHHEKITIKGLRGLSSITIDDFKRVNLFVGRNNCGKTSVLEGLFMITGISNPKIPITLNRFRGIDYFLGDDKDYKLIFNELNYENGVEIFATTQSVERKLKIEPHYQLENKEIKTTFDKNSFEKPDINTYQDNQAVDGLEYTFSIQNKQYKASIIQNGLLFNQSVSKNYKENLLGTFVIPRTILDLLPERLNKLIIGKRKAGIIKVLQQVEPSIQDLSIGTNRMIYCDIGLNQLVPINVMGDGIRRMLSLVVTIANMKNGCVFIDEIENGLHSKTLEILWKAIFEASKEYNVQIFATTHSYECISAFQKTFSYNKHPQDPDEIRLYRIEKGENKHIAHKMTNDMLATMLNDNWEIR